VARGSRTSPRVVGEIEMARPPSGPELVEGAEGSPDAKARLRVILETIAGTKTIAEACEALGIGEAAFHKLRTRVLQEAVEGLEPRKPGRKPKETSAEEEVVQGLQVELEKLKLELRAARIREELALTMPYLVKRGKKNEKERGGNPEAGRGER
jgi:hypothetical protein